MRNYTKRKEMLTIFQVPMKDLLFHYLNQIDGLNENEEVKKKRERQLIKNKIVIK